MLHAAQLPVGEPWRQIGAQTPPLQPWVVGHSPLIEQAPQDPVAARQPGWFAGQSCQVSHCTHLPLQNGVPASSAVQSLAFWHWAQPLETQMVPVPASTHWSAVVHWTQKPVV